MNKLNKHPLDHSFSRSFRRNHPPLDRERKRRRKRKRNDDSEDESDASSSSSDESS